MAVGAAALLAGMGRALGGRSDALTQLALFLDQAVDERAEIGGADAARVAELARRQFVALDEHVDVSLRHAELLSGFLEGV